MAKRFFDGDMWNEAEFRGLSADMKLTFFYIYFRCDCAGIWTKDIDLLNFQTGLSIKNFGDLETAGLLETINDKYFLCPLLIKNQYGNLILDPANKIQGYALERLHRVGGEKLKNRFLTGEELPF